MLDPLRVKLSDKRIRYSSSSRKDYGKQIPKTIYSRNVNGESKDIDKNDEEK